VEAIYGVEAWKTTSNSVNYNLNGATQTCT
jgi:hypothetical protein